ncbi:hypothetical protein [Macrococcoides bohemicum]|uniref:hypothetical protein n=1 Tax=Macrococcoides bohemicum TaxID=1903056 RepID=UPI0028A5BA63|nr:hypothetical protein [Macrococcus bohemicus]
MRNTSKVFGLMLLAFGYTLPRYSVYTSITYVIHTTYFELPIDTYTHRKTFVCTYVLDRSLIRLHSCYSIVHHSFIQ